MSVDNFIPTIWSNQILHNLYTALRYAQTGVTNRDYEGEIQGSGSSVKINAIGRVSVYDYTKNTDHASPDTLTSSQLTLNIDQQKFFNFQIDDVDRAQATPEIMGEATKESAYALAKTADSFVASQYTQAGNTIGSDVSPIVVSPNGTNPAYELLVDMATQLDQNDIPEDGRWVVVPPWFEGMLAKDNRFVGYGTLSNREALLNGQIGAAAGFQILKSNQVPNTAGTPPTAWKILAGHPMAWSFAEQINSVRAFQPEHRFADALKGLHVYGAKVTRPYSLVCLTANSA